MQRGQFHRIDFLAVAPFQERHQRNGLRQIHQAAFALFAFACQPVAQFLHVAPAVFRHFAIVVAHGQQVVFVIDVFEQILNGRARIIFLRAASVIVQQRHKLLQRFAAFAGQCGQRVQAACGLKQAAFVLLGIIVQFAQRGIADAAFGCSSRAQKCRVVVRVRQHAHIRQHVFDFGFVVKTLPARNRVGDMGGAQCLLENPRLMVAAVEHGKIGILRAVNAFLLVNLLGDVFRFALLVVAHHNAHGIAFPQLRPQGFGKQFRVVGNHLVGNPQNPRGGTVILFQLNHFELRIILLQAAQVFHVRTAPGINALVVVAHCRELPFQSGQTAQQRVLAGVGVLAFVHQQVTQPLLPFQADVAVLLQQQHGQAD